jgi:hypothetical protein
MRLLLWIAIVMLACKGKVALTITTAFIENAEQRMRTNLHLKFTLFPDFTM